MRKGVLGLLCLATTLLAAEGQTINTPNGFYKEEIEASTKAMPYPFVRESDVVWSMTLWKNIDVAEAFNQYIYFPTREDDTSGRRCLANVIWKGVENEEIPIFEDDMLKIPLDNQVFIAHYTKPDTTILQISYDDEDEEEYENIITPNDFEAEDITQWSLREIWFIGKQNTRQDSRRMALAPMKDMTFELGNSGIEIKAGRQPLFWIPMQNMRVRNVLARNSSHFAEGNEVGQPSWDYVFIEQLYSAYTTRATNRYERKISNYMTGEDAVVEAARIEEMIFDIESDMWEY